MRKTTLLTLSAALAICLSASLVHATALWTFEVSQPATAGNGTSTFAAELGADAATSYANGSHASGSAVYSTPAGNGSAHSFSANGWVTTSGGGDYWQFSTPTGGSSSMSITWDQTGSATGPAHFKLQESNDGTTFSDVASYTVLLNGAPNPAWATSGAGLPSAAYSFSQTLSGLTASTVWARLVQTDNVSINGGTVAAGGTDRVDNMNIGGVVPEPASIVLAGTCLIGLAGFSLRRKS
jgi:PEP-CTERM motif